MDTPLKYILHEGNGVRYVMLENTVGHRWYFPWKNMRAYMSLFQPSSLKGSIVALLLPLLKYFPKLLRFVKAQRVQLQFEEQFIGTLENALGKPEITCSVFCGSPGLHKKPTLLLLSEGKCGGYCKISDNADIVDLFKKEESTLRYLNNKGVRHIPHIVYCAPWQYDESLWLMIQTTERQRKVKVALSSDQKVIDFVQQMLQATKQKLRYEDTDYAQTLQNLERLVPLLCDKERERVVLENINIVKEKLQTGKHDYSAFHGDLTPWNSFVVNGHLYAFDFEYFKRSYPPLADYFHFFTQSQIYDNYARGEQITANYRRIKKERLTDVTDSDFLYRCYLLAIMEFYLNRDHGYLTERLKDIFGIWTYLLIHIKNGGVIQ